MPKKEPEQLITVTTKGQLLAAFECARQCPYGTRINLKRKSGCTTFFICKNNDKFISKLKSKLLRLSAADLIA